MIFGHSLFFQQLMREFMSDDVRPMHVELTGLGGGGPLSECVRKSVVGEQLSKSKLPNCGAWSQAFRSAFLPASRHLHGERSCGCSWPWPQHRPARQSPFLRGVNSPQDPSRMLSGPFVEARRSGDFESGSAPVPPPPR